MNLHKIVYFSNIELCTFYQIDFAWLKYKACDNSLHFSEKTQKDESEIDSLQFDEIFLWKLWQNVNK